MKKSIALLLVMAALTAASFILPAPATAESAISIPLSVSYNSTYWWRGVELNGKGVGVLWLGAGLEIAGTGLTFYVYSAISEDYLIQSDVSTPDRQANRDFQKSITEFDYGASWEKTFNETITVGASFYYVHYPFYDEAGPGAPDPTFLEASVFVGYKTVLNPKITLFYDYYVEESDSDTPNNEDYYVHFAVSQALMEVQGFSFTLGAWIGYYNNAYMDRSGWSDAGANAGISFSHGDASFTSSFNYARSLTEDFQIDYSNVTDMGILKNHMWLEFEAIYKI
ncbi:MAG: hypothetical protein KBA61_06500 [Spirochaetes bacterium]|nr:hypothetical protein [Spirochaetota bacterium]